MPHDDELNGEGPDREAMGPDAAEAELASPEPELVERGFHPGGILDSLHNRDFRWFFGGAILSNIGTWMQMIAVGWIVTEMTKSELWVGLANFTASLPTFLFVFFAGVLADRFDRRRLIIGTQSILMLLAFLLAYLTTSGHLTMPVLLSVTLLTGLVTALTFPAWMAIISDIVPRRDLLNAIALNSAQFNGARMIGPAIAGVVLGYWGAGADFFANGVSYIFIIIAFYFIRPTPNPHSAAGQNVWKSLGQGFRFAFETKEVLILLLAMGMLSFFGMPYITLMPVFAAKVFGLGGKEYGFLMAANGMGAVFGAVLVAWTARHARRETLIKYSLLSFGALVLLFTFVRNYYLAMVVLAVAGSAFMIVASTINTSLQTMTPNRLRGRIMSMFTWCFQGWMPLGSLVFGAIGQRIGAPLAIGLGAGVIVLLGIYLILRLDLQAVEDSLDAA